MRRALGTICLCFLGLAAVAQDASDQPVRLIFDTDMGNDVDDAFALAVIHALQSRGACELLAVTITKDNELAGPFADAINTFYGRGEIPVGVVRDGSTQAVGRYLELIQERGDDGELVFPHRLARGRDAPEAVSLLRSILAEQPEIALIS